MKKDLLFQFLELSMSKKLQEADDFEEDIPDNAYLGDVHIPDQNNYIKDIEKKEDDFELEKQVPTTDYKSKKVDFDTNIPNTDGTDFLTTDDKEEELSQEFLPKEDIPIENNDLQMNNDTQFGGQNTQFSNMPPGGDPNMMGGMMPPIPEPLDPSSIGKVYILKKIYSRLVAVHNNLSYMASPKFDEIKKLVAESIEHFQNVIKNFDQFKDKLDEIIILFQRFLVGSVNKIEKLIIDRDYFSEEIDE